MIKLIYYTIIFAFLHSLCYAAITFDANGKWETTFDCTAQSQLDAFWGDGSCDDIVKATSGGVQKFNLTDGVTNLWERSGTNDNEWYYTGQDIPAQPTTVFVNFVCFTTDTLGGLSVNRFAYGDNDSLGYDTIYIRQNTPTDDPDSGGDGFVHIFVGSDPVQADDIFSSISSDSNNATGGGGLGHRRYITGGVNSGSGGLMVYFQTGQQELWVRWYMRYASPFRWQIRDEATGPYPTYDKHFFFNTGGTPDAIPEYKGREYAISSQGTVDSGSFNTSSTASSGTLYQSGQGWPTIMGFVTDEDTDASRETKMQEGGVSDGLYHCFEVHLKMDTTGLDGVGNNGVGQMWIDGKLILDSNTQDWSGPIGEQATVREGWVSMILLSNQGYVEGDGIASIFATDIDDIVIYNTTPPNKDTDGNDYIGPVETSSTTCTVDANKTVSSSPTTYSGTASAVTGETITGVVSSGGFTVTPDDGAWDEQTEAFTVSGVIVPESGVTDTCTATSSDASAAQDSITISLFTPSESDGYYSLRVGNPGVSVNSGINIGKSNVYVGGFLQSSECNAMLLEDGINALLLSDGLNALLLD